MILTRFNLPSHGQESLVRAKDGWLRDRVELFERYCLPSVERQTERDFQWLVYFDPASPSWLKERVHNYGRTRLLTPLFRDAVPREALLRDLARGQRSGTTRLITTNLDNDDALAVDFIARVQASDPGRDRVCLYLENGLIRRGQELYTRRDRSNAFCSVAEPPSHPVTCWSNWHNLLPQDMDALFFGGAPAWLQVVHGGNVSNRVRGRLCAPTRYGTRFPGLLEDVSTPTVRETVLDALLQAPARFSKEVGRSALKAAVFRLLGRTGLDRAKYLWGSRGQASRQLIRTALLILSQPRARSFGSARTR